MKIYHSYHLFAFALLVYLSHGVIYAQNTMRITYQDGSKQDISVDRIYDITFLELAEQPFYMERALVGTWVWGKKEAGYYEVITFNKDHTYMGDDCYYEYGFNSTTYGTYFYSGITLNLRSNGYGYMRTYRWFVTSLTENALEVMTQTGPYVYYRLQSETIHLKAGGDPLECKEGESFVFADGVNAKLEENKLYGIKAGTTYIQIMDTTSSTIKAYMVIIEA